MLKQSRVVHLLPKAIKVVEAVSNQESYIWPEASRLELLRVTVHCKYSILSHHDFYGVNIMAEC